MALITKLDRLGRFLKSILKNIDDIYRKDASLLSLDGVINTSNESHMANAIVNLLGTFTQLERDLIISRTKEGRERAMAHGKLFERVHAECNFRERALLSKETKATY